MNIEKVKDTLISSAQILTGELVLLSQENEELKNNVNILKKEIQNQQGQATEILMRMSCVLSGIVEALKEMEEETCLFSSCGKVIEEADKVLEEYSLYNRCH